MNRLLLVTYAFPPQPAAGALRPGYLARYLPEFGWDVTAVTHSTQTPPFETGFVPVGGGEVQMHDRMRSAIGNGDPDAPLRRALRRAKDALIFPDPTAGWIPRAVHRARAAMREQRFDAILSTALPSSVHVIGWWLARGSGLPWIADYRDAWCGNPYFRWGPVQSFLEHAAERQMLRRAHALTTVSEPIAAQLRALHKRADVHVIPNAYDPAEWDAIGEARPTRFDLCYTGSMYDGKRSPEILFAAIRELRQAGHPAGSAARVHFYGPNSENVALSAPKHGLTLAVRQHGVVPRAEAMRAQRSAAVLLLFLNMDPATANEMGSKYLEYVGAGRPVLAFGPRDSVMREFVGRNGLGWFASDVEEAKAALAAAYERFGSGAFGLTTNAQTLPTARDLAAAFAGRLDEAVGRTRSARSYRGEVPMAPDASGAREIR